MWTRMGRTPRFGVLPPLFCGLAPRADWLGLKLPFHRPTRRGTGTRAWGLLLRPFGLTGSAMNSAQENSVCCGSSSTNFQPHLTHECLGRLSIEEVRVPASLKL